MVLQHCEPEVVNYLNSHYRLLLFLLVLDQGDNRHKDHVLLPAVLDLRSLEDCMVELVVD